MIGHNESLSSPYHRELYKPWAHQTHQDWKHADMDIYRARLRALSPPTTTVSSRRERIELGLPARRRGHPRVRQGLQGRGEDGHAGEVSWAVYAPGESYLVVMRHPHLGGKHHVVPAGAVTAVDHEKRVVRST